MSDTGKTGVMKELFLLYLYFLISEILLFHTCCLFAEINTYPGFLEGCRVCLLGIVSVCELLALLTDALSLPKIKAAFMRTGETPCWTRYRFLGFVLMLLAVNG